MFWSTVKLSLCFEHFMLSLLREALENGKIWNISRLPYLPPPPKQTHSYTLTSDKIGWQTAVKLIKYHWIRFQTDQFLPVLPPDTLHIRTCNMQVICIDMDKGPQFPSFPQKLFIYGNVAVWVVVGGGLGV